MSHQHSSGGADNYEKKDVRVSVVAGSLVLLTFFIVAGIVISYASYAGLEFWMKKHDPPLPPMLQTHVVVPEPRLQVRPADDLALFQKEQQETLNSYAWVDREAGVARIPIQRAMEILAENPKIFPKKPIQEQKNA